MMKKFPIVAPLLAAKKDSERLVKIPQQILEIKERADMLV
jgi:hypothetical protein